jgi:hypothetical protein
VPEELLHGADVVSRVEQMRRERVAQGVRRRRLCYARVADRLTHRALERLIAEMMAARHAVARIDGTRGRRKHVLPAPLLCCVRVLARERRRHPHRAVSVREILIVLCAHFVQNPLYVAR